MAARQGFSERAWQEIINADMAGEWVDAAVAAAKKRPDAPFADTGPLLRAMLDKGVTRDQLCRLARAIRYEAVYETLRLASEAGLDEEQLEGVHEELLTADPSGKDGRPGSWPVEAPPAPKRPKATSKSATTRGRSASERVDPDAPPRGLPKADDFTFSPDGSRLWLAHTSINTSTVRGIDIPAGTQFAEFNSLPNLRGLACSADGTRVAASNHFGIVAAHDAASGKEIWKSPRTGDETRCLAYAPDGSMVLNTGGGPLVRRRDAGTGKELPPLDLGAGWLAGTLAFSPDGVAVAVAAVRVPGAPHVSYWDWRKATERGRHPSGNGLRQGLGFLPGGRGLVTAGFKEVNLWDVKSHDRTGSFVIEEAVRSSSVHPTRMLLAVSTRDGSEIRELPSGALRRRFDTKQTHPSHWAFSPDGRYVLLVASPKSFLWDLETLSGPR